MASGHRRGFVDERLVGAASGRIGTEHGMFGHVAANRPSVVGEARLDPLDPVHLGTFTRQ